MSQYYTPNTFAPLRPITPARVNIWPPNPTETVTERRYSQSSGGGGTTGIPDYIIMALFTLGALLLAIYIWRSMRKGAPKAQAPPVVHRPVSAAT